MFKLSVGLFSNFHSLNVYFLLILMFIEKKEKILKYIF